MLINAEDTPPESPSQILEMDDDDEFVELNEDDVEEVVEDALLAAVEGYYESDEEDGMEELVSSPPIRDDADFVFTKHKGKLNYYFSYFYYLLNKYLQIRNTSIIKLLVVFLKSQ